MYTLNKHVRWRKDRDNILICDCKRLIDLKIPLDFEKTMEKIERGDDGNELEDKGKVLLKDFENLKLLANIEFRPIRRDEFNLAMKLLDKELEIRVRDNKFLFEKFKKFGGLFIGLFLDNEIIGLICGFPREDYILISEISVDERFQNRGFGKRLVKIFEKKALKFGNKINVGAMDNAINFYNSLNYKPFLLIQFKKSDYSLKNFKNFKILKEKDYNDDVNLEVKIEKSDLRVISNLRKKYPKASFQYIFTKEFN